MNVKIINRLLIILGTILVPLSLLSIFLGGCGEGVSCTTTPEDKNNPGDEFGIQFWPEGRIPYRFSEEEKVRFNDDPVNPDDRDVVRDMMNIWEDAFTLEDPANPGQLVNYILFEECTDDCPETGYLLIRYNYTDLEKFEDNDMCDFQCDVDLDPWCDERKGQIGWLPGSILTLHLNRLLDENTTLHELGHCLGLWHEQNRADRERWLLEDARFCYDKAFPYRSIDMPTITNYDYDSIMHYASFTATHGTTGTFRFADRRLNAFSRWELQKHPGQEISPRLKSRMLQYYAYGHQANWGFFEPLHIPSPTTNTHVLPNPYLDLEPDPDIEAVGSPAIAFQSPGNFDIFSRGSNNHLYWMSIRGINRSNWTSLGCCFGADPSAVSRGDGEIDLVTIGADSRRVVYNRYGNGEWGDWVYLHDENPPGGIKEAAGGGYIGPAITSRGHDSLDVFSVQDDGLLAVTTLENGVWSAWNTLGSDYNVTARPAAVAVSPTMVKLAVNESNNFLSEGTLSFEFSDLSFSIGRTAVMAVHSPPAMTARDDPGSPYRVLISNADGRLSHKFAAGNWRDIGGIPLPGTGPSAVASGQFGSLIVINGEDATGCDLACLPGAEYSPNPDGELIQPGGLWLREFK